MRMSQAKLPMSQIYRRASANPDIQIREDLTFTPISREIIVAISNEIVAYLIPFTMALRLCINAIYDDICCQSEDNLDAKFLPRQ
jgi:hypothetical protein